MSDDAPKHPDVLETLFGEVSDLPLQQHAAFLDARCAGDPKLRAELESLLAADARAGGFFNDATIDGSRIDAARPPSGSDQHIHIGPYKLLHPIGEGGFGTVYLAEQERPVRRRLAIKVIKLGMDTRQVIARFEAERQALAIMDHPDIAKVFDAGATDAGRPYFAMEWVEGSPITEYCDRNGLSITGRMELFARVCHAVQHAHQKGLIHRDIKSSNILVSTRDGRPAPKVIDFGIAKATGARLTERTVFTESHQLIGTPEYMSPEQASGDLDVDTRSDVYSLGVLLYELLTGTTPFDARDLRSKAYAEIQRIIREVDPPAPSTRLSRNLDGIAGVAAVRQIDAAKLHSRVRGELDWIAMKCLEKDRGRRYETANALAADVQRYLSGEAIAAAPPSKAYRFTKFVKRNRTPVITAALFVALLIVGVIGTSIGLVGAARQRAIAEQQRANAQAQEREAKQQAAIATAVSDFQTDMFDTADPQKLMGDKVTVLQAISAAVDELDRGKLKSQPAVEAAVRSSIGHTLRSLGRYDRAEPNLRKALELRRSALPAGHPDISKSVSRLALLLREQGKLPEAEVLFREALALRRAALPGAPAEVAQALNNLASVLFGQGKFVEAEAHFREALEINRSLPADEWEPATTLNNLAVALRVQGKLADAQGLLRESLELRRRTMPANHPDTAATLQSLAQVLQASGQLDEAEPLYREALAIRRSALPARHPDIAMALNNLAFLLTARQKYAESEPLCREALAICRESLAAGHPHIAATLEGLAAVLRAQGRLDECEPLFREALGIRRSALPAGHPDIGASLHNLGSVLRDQSRFADGEVALLEAERLLGAARGVPAAQHERCVEGLVALYASWSQADPGKGHEASAERWRAQLTPPRPATEPTDAVPTSR